jgi:hypothetical protein
LARPWIWAAQALADLFEGGEGTREDFDNALNRHYKKTATTLKVRRSRLNLGA